MPAELAEPFCPALLPDEFEVTTTRFSVRPNTDLFNDILNSGNGLIVFNSSSANPNVTSTRSC